MCGGLEWSAIPHVAEILGYEDVELMIAQLAAIRDHHQNQEQ
jgi:hypothetical protein